MRPTLFPKLQATIDSMDTQSLTEDRKTILSPLISYIDQKKRGRQEVNLIFICTHNSRRSQFSQIWAQVAAWYYGVDAKCFSGGIEVTAFNERAVEAIRQAGFHISKKGDDNPVYFVFCSEDADPITTYSKIYDDAVNTRDNFAAVMTCDHADENCPFIPGAEARIPVWYNDPKEFDGTPQENEKYEERSLQIATEMFYVFSKIKTS